MPWNRFARLFARDSEVPGRTAFLHDDEGMLDVVPFDNRAREEAFLARAATLPPPGRRDGTVLSAYLSVRMHSVAIR